MRGRVLPTVAAFLAIGLAGGSAGFVLAGCDRTPTVADYLAKSPTLRGKDRIRIGVNGNQQLMGYFNPADNSYSGFDIEIARYVARSLGFREQEISWVRVEVEDRERVLETNLVDLVVASYSITEERAKRVNFAGPYLIVSQEVLVPTARKAQLDTITELLKARLCTTGGSTSEEHLRGKGFTPNLEISDKDCRDGILAGRYDAMSSDLTILAGYRSQEPDRFTIVDVPIGESERLGIGVPKNDPYLRDVITKFLLDSYRKGEDSPWRAAFDKTLGTALPDWANVGSQPEPMIYQELRDHDDAG